ncbi:unnamed protein product [Hyaloperonospora brassicae]|uniref:Sulfhydryl oxidase n=1 Tax=Hyaloperonospora brassicae TaxID=162125 RepID=A0AAV0SY93_HYABA|nr:unnamed protein product [Hyaloperonospora brassicae]
MLNSTNAIWLVDFYSPWCPHCRQFAPIWEQASTVYKDVRAIAFGAVDCTKQNKICNDEDVHSYPGVKLYHASRKANATAAAAIVMHSEEFTSAKDVVTWIEETVKANGLQPLLDSTAVYPKHTTVQRGEKKTFGDPVEPLQNDRSPDVRLQRLQDAGATALFTFEDGFFLGTTVLEGKRYEAAVTWIRALAASFPRKENREALTVLVREIKQRERWELAEWRELLDKWKATANAMSDPANLFRDKDKLVLCTTATCGLWTLFHLITASDNTSAARSEPWKPSEVMEAIRLMVKHFFGCDKCRRHFLKINSDSAMQKLVLRDDDGPEAVVLWLWMSHNLVNAVIGKPMWPTQRSCPQCYVGGNGPLTMDSSRLNEEDIVAYVRDIYEFGDELTLGQESRASTSWVSLGSIATAALFFAIGAALFQLHKHRTTQRKTLDHAA